MTWHEHHLDGAVAQVEQLSLLQVEFLAVVRHVAHSLVSRMHPHLGEEAVATHMVHVVVADDHI